MSRDSTPPGKKIERGPLFIKQLKDRGQIEKNLFAFNMESAEDEAAGSPSFIDFGMAVDKNMRNPDQIVWIPMAPHFFWMTNNNRAVRIGPHEFSIGGKTYSVIFDSGTSITLVPPKIFKPLMQKLCDLTPGLTMWP